MNLTSKLIKILSIILCGFLVLGLAGCENGNSDSGSSSDIGEEETKSIKVGYIFRRDADADGFSGQINAQRKNAVKNCGGKVETYYIDNVAVADFESAVKALYSYGCEVIVSCSSTYTNVLSSIASRYMNISFINFGSLGLGTANVTSYVEDYYQGAYIAGTIAAYNSKNSKIGIVCDGNMHGIYPIVNAAAMGMRNVYKSAEMCVVGATADNEIEEAVDALTAEGCDVIICYTESPHSADYCEQKGVKFIGSLDYSSNEDDYENMIMYFYSKRDSFFLAKFKELQFDEWETAPYQGTMANGLINVSEALPKAKEKTQDIIDSLAPVITSGQLYIFKGEIRDINGIVKYMQKDILTEEEIYALNWYVQGVKVVGNFRRPNENPVPNNFEIKS